MTEAELVEENVNLKYKCSKLSKQVLDILEKRDRLRIENKSCLKSCQEKQSRIEALRSLWGYCVVEHPVRMQTATRADDNRWH